MRAALLFGAYLLAAGLGDVLSVQHSYSTLWPSCGLVLAVLLLSDFRDWPILIAAGALGGITADALEGRILLVSAGFALANAAEAFIGAMLVRKALGERPGLQTVREVFAFVTFGAVLAPVIGASAGTAIEMLSGITEPWWVIWGLLWAGHVAGVIMVASPILLSVAWWKEFRALDAGARRARFAPLALGAAVGAVATVASWFIFNSASGVTPFKFLLFPGLLTAGAVGGPFVAGVSVFSVAVAGMASMANRAVAVDSVTGAYAIAVLEAQGALLVAGITAVATSVALVERKRLAAVAVDNASRLQAVIDSAPFGAHLYRLEPDDRLVFTGFNRKAEEILGIDHSPLLGLTLEEAFAGNVGREASVQYRRVARDGGIWALDQYTYDADGIAGIFEINAFPFGPNEMAVFFRDVTDERRAGAELEASREHLRATVEQAAIGIARVSLDGAWLDANDCLCEMLGYTLEELRARTFADVTHPEERGKGLEVLQRLKSGELSDYCVEKRYITKDGSVIWVKVAVTVARKAGVPAYLVAIVDDIGKRKRAETALANTATALRALSGVNEALVRAQSEEELLKSVCDAIADNRTYALVWVGYAKHDKAKSVVPVESSGIGLDYVGTIDASWGDGPRGQGPTGRCIREKKPIVMRHMDTDPLYQPWREAALAQGFQSSLAVPLVSADGVAFGTLGLYSQEAGAFEGAVIALLSQMAEDLSFGIEAIRSKKRREEAERDLRHAHRRLESVMRSIIETMGKVAEVRDPYTQGHEMGVAKLSRLIAEEMGLSKHEADGIEIAALVHDIGKLSVPAEILVKPGRLSFMEFALIKEHPQTGYEILRDIDFDWPVADVALQHHERCDGSGYPNGLLCRDTLLAARIVAVADVVEAMASHRPYRPSLGLQAAIAEIQSHAEKYDPQVVEVCVRLYESDRIDFLAVGGLTMGSLS